MTGGFLGYALRAPLEMTSEYPASDLYRPTPLGECGRGSTAVAARKRDERGILKTALCAVLPREMSLRIVKRASGDRTRRCHYAV